jgi:hypothetical protein
MTRAKTEQAGTAPATEASLRFAICIPMLDEGATAVALLEACHAAAAPIGPLRDLRDQ